MRRRERGETERDRHDVAHEPAEPDGLCGFGERAIGIAQGRPDDRRDPKRVCPGARRAGKHLEERLERALKLGEIAFGQPVLEQVAADRNANLGRALVLEAELKGRPEVCALGPESSEGLDLTPVMCAGDGGEVRHPGEMATPEQQHRITREVLPAGLAQDFEHAEPLAPGLLTAMNERLLDEGADDGRNGRFGQSLISADLLRCVDLESTRENGQPRKEELLLGREELVAPVDRRLHRSLMGKMARIPGAEHLHLRSQAIAQGLDPQGVKPDRGELEREWQSVELAAQLQHSRRTVRVEREAASSSGGALDEQRHSVGPPRLAGGAIRGSGIDIGWTCSTTSPATPSAWRLVARIWRSGHPRSNVPARTATPSRTCSQLSRTSSKRFSARCSASMLMVQGVERS